MECNTQKGETAAADFLRRLYRERRLTATELAARLRALDALTSGKLRLPCLPSLSQRSTRSCPINDLQEGTASVYSEERRVHPDAGRAVPKTRD
jgi:hypothetical protein